MVQQTQIPQMWCQPYEPTPDHVPQSDDDDNWPGPDEINEAMKALAPPAKRSPRPFKGTRSSRTW